MNLVLIFAFGAIGFYVWHVATKEIPSKTHQALMCWVAIFHFGAAFAFLARLLYEK